MANIEDIFATGPVMLFKMTNDDELSIEFVSDNTFEILEINADDFYQNKKTFISLIHPEDRERVQRAINAKGPYPFIMEDFRLISNKGRPCWVHATISLLEESLYALVVDITEFKDEEKYNQILSTAVEQSFSSVIITDDKGIIEYINPAYSKLSGYKKEELVGQNPRVLKSDEQPKEFYEEFWQTIKEGKIWKGSFKNRKKDGNFFWDRTVVSPIRNEDGIITHFIGVKEDVTEQKILRAKVDFLAFHDSLTTLPNRAKLREHIDKVQEKLNKDDTLGAGIIFFDLDDFKYVNDSMGHEAGDQVLVEVSTRIRAEIRENDMLARLGGDEFALVLVIDKGNDPRTECLKIAKRVLNCATTPILIGDERATVGASIGIAVSPEHSDNLGECIRLADEAMYKAKEAGKNTVFMYEPE